MKRKPAPSKSPHVWTKKHLSLLGKITDGALAQQLGITTGAVFQKRASMGITSSRPFSRFVWGPKEIALLGKYPDTEVARQLSLDHKVVLNKRVALGIECFARSTNTWHQWTPEEIALIGTALDRVVAEKVGVSTASVTFKRRQLKIPTFRARKTSNRPRRSMDAWPKKEIALLGTMGDSQLAEKLDLSPATVRYKRISLGIPPYGRKKS
jgi:hypothetical protein